MDRGSHGSRGYLTHRTPLGLAYAFSLLTTYLLLQPGATSDESTPFGDFRGFFPFDQLAYAGIASNAASGNFAAVEPFTETGTSFYPSAWYLLIGAMARVTGIGVPAVWTILGGLSVAAAVIVVGFSAYRLSGRVWAPALVGPALWIGPLALAVGERWYLPLRSHAVLWGPYGELFSLNAEAVAISLGAITLILLLLAAQRSQKSRSSLVLVLTAGVMVGALANIHTYAFLVTVGFLATWIAITGIGLAGAKRSLLIWLSLGLFLGVALAGSLVAPLRASLTVFVLMLVAALPGGLVIARRVPLLAITGIVAAAVTATPQVLRVLQGLQANDPFLAYRQVQSGDLGIDPLSFLIATLPIGLWVITLTIATRHTSLPIPAKTFVPSGLLALIVLSFNNVWGFVQEPYRMWIASLTLTTLMAVPLTAFVLANGAKTWSRGAVRLTALSALAAIVLSWWNVGGFRTYVGEVEPISFASARLQALGNLATGRGGLFATDPCIDPSHLKIASRERVAFYITGLAWPANRAAIDAVIETREMRILDPETLRKARVTYLVTDSACSVQWDPAGTNDFAFVNEIAYGSDDDQAFLRLWLLQ